MSGNGVAPTPLFQGNRPVQNVLISWRRRLLSTERTGRFKVSVLDAPNLLGLEGFFVRTTGSECPRKKGSLGPRKIPNFSV